MAAHLNITSTYGVTQPTGTQLEEARKSQSVEIAELVGGATGEYVKADPIHMKKVEVTLSGDGPSPLGDIASATVGTPSTLTKVSVEMSEAPNGRVSFNLVAAGHEGFTDGGGATADAGAEPTLDDLEITSVEYAIGESVKRARAVEDMVLPGSNGQPAARATCKEKGSFTINGRGDLPAGMVVGSGGAALKNMGAGKLVVTQLNEFQRRAQWNGWGVDGSHYRLVA